jgi:peptidoglycan hydrolase CwlO-like protein
MFKDKQNVLLLIIVILAGWNILTTNRIKTDINGYRDKIESIQTKVDSAKTVNTKIGVKIDSVKQKVITINNEVHHIDKTITVVKQKTNEKTNTINKFSNPELEYFFTNRYNPNFNSIKNGNKN